MDQSGSTVDSMVNRTILASIFAGLPKAGVHLIAYDTQALDLTPWAHDRFETLLRTSLGASAHVPAFGKGRLSTLVGTGPPAYWRQSTMVHAFELEAGGGDFVMARRDHVAEDGEEDGAWDAQWEGGDGTGLRFTGTAPDCSARPFMRTRQESLEDDVVKLVNQERAERGLVRLHMEERLRMSSRHHSRDMAARSFFAHVSPEGGTPDERMLAAGYPYPAAENIAIFEPNAMAVVRAWMNSPGHRVNILHPHVRAIGVGMFLDAHTRLAWWTQNFGYV